MAYDVACIGTSWGGLYAVRAIVQDLSDELPLALVVVQHRHRDSDAMLVSLLQDCTGLPVQEVEDKEPVERGVVYVAPPNYHLLFDDGGFALSTDAPVRFSRPSIDVTFESAAYEYGPRAIGIVLTGANDDGAAGLRLLAQSGGVPLVQDPATAESATMPAAALRAVPSARVLPLEGIAPALIELAGGGAVRDKAPR